MARNKARVRQIGLGLLAMLGLLLGLTAAPASGAVAAPAAPAAAAFKVLAFYSGTYDAAHIDFVKEANEWFPKTAAANNFSYEATNNWDRLSNVSDLKQYQVILFLDDAPHGAAQRSGFEQYMRGGGGWMGFHVSAFTTNAGEWPWYYNDFLGSGNFQTNTWGPEAATLKVEDHSLPNTANLPATFTSAVSEWYSWSNDLRQNPNIKILASVDPVSFPLGTDPNQDWTSGYYPILWTNTQYKMVYNNFGHNDMNYSNNTRLSSTFASETQNRYLIDSLKWLGTGQVGDGGGTPPGGPISETAWYTLANSANGKCVDAKAAATANGTDITQYACNGTGAQQYQIRATDGGFSRIGIRANPQQVVDVRDVSLADNAALQLWSYTGGTNQQWKAVAETSGRYHFTARHSGKCLSAPANTTDGAQLVQSACNGSAAQSFQLTQQP
ncbi:1,4-beta-xylanase [Streptomyces sp. 150FB]|uniref:ThuA domain-containing protein n=1 Tax=Streptomyces sp. 150FB TaxID=1576605 RepID=UPI0005893913|nr:ThuA domain-containing protein [Streptomyces sp. 150FB]KIF74914.1 1,4-beta-xylanase [Streptomyces sp. 150FB]